MNEAAKRGIGKTAAVKTGLDYYEFGMIAKFNIGRPCPAD